MNTLRIADALENFGAGSSREADPAAMHSSLFSRQELESKLAAGKGDARGQAAGHKKRSLSTECFQHGKRPAVPRPLTEVQQGSNGRVHNAHNSSNNNNSNARQCNVAANLTSNCIPRYSQGLTSDQLRHEGREIALLRSRVIVQNTDFNHAYDLGGTIGQGTFGKVKKATDKASGDVVAVKMLGGKQFGTNELRAFLNECDILSEIDHANVPNLCVHALSHSFPLPSRPLSCIRYETLAHQGKAKSPEEMTEKEC